MKISRKAFEIQKALGTTSLYSIAVPRILTPNSANKYHLFIDAINEDDAREKICNIRPELEIYKNSLEIRRCFKKESGEIVWHEN